GQGIVMGRLWFCLPLCLLLQDQRPLTSGAAMGEDTGPPPASPAHKRRLEISRFVTAMAAVSPAGFPATLAWTPLRGLSDHLVPRTERISRDLAAGVAALA